MDLGTTSPRRLAIELLAASFVVLFQELALIRWLPGQIRVLAYFPNLILLSAFLGLGVGCLRAGRRDLRWLWLPSLIAVAGAALALSRVVFAQDSGAEHLYLLYYDLPADDPKIRDVRLPILLFFVLGAVSFVPLGQIVAERLEELRRRSRALQGYSWDILGSLTGVAAFTALGFMGVFPVVWFGVFLAAGCCSSRGAAGRGSLTWPSPRWRWASWPGRSGRSTTARITRSAWTRDPMPRASRS